MKIVVAMSGGVDSAVAAALLAEAGHDVIGLSMQLYDQTLGEDRFGSCCSIDDLHDARRAAHAIGIPHYLLNFEREFDAQVVVPFVAEYAAGRTPIPCTRCNTDVKFATLAARAAALGAERVATGHYAQVSQVPDTGRWRLRRSVDPSKDQTYFLFGLTQDQLSVASFPVGHLTKAAVRDIARARALPVADKPDSQEICFVPGGDYAAFVERRLDDAPAAGPILDQDGHTVGHHGGVHRFTVGQRKGLGIPAEPDGRPRYVLALRPAEQAIVVGPRDALAQQTLEASAVNWIEPMPSAARRVTAQIRHRHPPAAASVEALPDGRARVTFDDPQPAITPGQAVVFYDDDVVVGGGWIDATGR